MKRAFVLIICLVLVFSSACSKSDPESEYNRALSLIEQGEYDKAYSVFEALGNYKDSATLLKRFVSLPTKIEKEDDGMLEGVYMYYTTYTYNEYGECISRVGEYENEVGPGFSEQDTYDDKGNLILRKAISEAGYSTITYEYDEDGKLIKETGCTDGANVGGITTYTYNERGLRTLACYSSYLGIDTEAYQSQEPYHTQTTEYYYDDSDRCVKVLEHYGEEYVFTYSVEYNDNSLPTSVVSDDGQGSKSTTVFKYDDKGRCTQITTPYDNTVYTYDESELPISAVYTRDGGQPCDIVYTYETYFVRNEPDGVPFHIKEHINFFEW